MTTLNRRYDIDWVRVIAIGLLLIYHVAIGFQAWGIMIGFITTSKPWPSLWIPMTMLNFWRIPLLFFVSGMGVFFAMQNRNWKQLMRERAARILIPYVAGILLIVPIHVYLWQSHNSFSTSYAPNPAHLWFLGNILAYVLLLSPVFYYLRNHDDAKITQVIKKIFGSPLGLLLVIGAFYAEALIIDPKPYELYAMTWHGFFLGFLAFFFGFCFVLSGKAFWEMIVRWRWLFLVVAAILFAFRFFYFKQYVPAYLLVTEADCWIFSVFAFACRYLNRPSKTLNYLSQAAYPVYILHMIFLSLGSLLIFPLDIPVPLQFVFVLVFTGVGCFVAYELIRRIKYLRPLLGLKMNQQDSADNRAAELRPIL